MAVMRACTQRLPWRTQYFGRSPPARCPARPAWRRSSAAPARMPGVKIQSPRETSTWRSSTMPADWPGLTNRPTTGRRTSATHRAVSPLGKICTCRRPSREPWAMRPHIVRGWWPVPSASSRATYCTGSSSCRRAPVGDRRVSSSCSKSEGRVPVPVRRRRGDVVAAQRRHRHDAARRGCRRPRRRRAAPSRTASRKGGAACGSIASSLLIREDDAGHAQQARQQAVAAGLRQQRHQAPRCRAW